jgi:glycosyltransferase involved in cell wall biosynthesis
MKNSCRQIKVGILTSELNKHNLSAPLQCQLRLIRDMLKENRRHIDFYFIHFDKSSKLDIYKKGKNIVIPKKSLRFGPYVKGLDILHTNGLIYKRLDFYFLPLKKIITMHGGGGFLLSSRYFSKKSIYQKKILYLFSIIGLLKKIDAFVTVSNDSGDALCKHLNIKKEQMVVIYNNIDNCMHSKKISFNILKARWGIECPFVLNVNNFAPKKNLETLIEAFALLIKNYNFSKYCLVLVGKDIRDNKVIKQIIRKHNIAQNVKLLNFVSQSDLPLLYSAAKVFVNPTLQESFGLSNVEAMSCGCPVITSNVPGVSEIVGDAAMLIDDPTNAKLLYYKIKKLLLDQELIKNLIVKGQERALLFKGSSAKNMLDFYERIVL